MNSSIRCPHCQDSIAIADARPGRFRIKCPRCGSPIIATIPDDPLGPPIAEKPPEPSTPDDPEAGNPTPPPSFEMPRPPRSLGGYRVVESLGPARAGGRYRGRDRATGRSVTLTIVKPRWAADAAFVARYAREAFASAQLDHPNLAPTLDFAIDRGLPFAASDARGDAPLSDPSKGRGGMDRGSRVAAILQAARGLRHAHEQGVYHRDLTLDSIRVDADGLVRLSGVGLGSTPDTPDHPPVVSIPLEGVPSPPPEPIPTGPARDDVAALGRALLTLLGGSKGDRAIPPGLASVARRLAGDSPDGPFADVGAAIRALEAELGVATPFTPRDEEAAEFEAAAAAFDEPPMVRARRLAASGLAGFLALLALLALIRGRPIASAGILGFGGLIGSALVAFRGISGRDPLFDRAREWLLGGSTGDKLTAASVVALLVGALAAMHLLTTAAFLAAFAVGLAAAYHFALDRPIAASRAGAIGRGLAVVRAWRRNGIEEESIRRFARAWGWEFFEAIFGHEAMRWAWGRWAPFDVGGRRRPWHARWRDPIIDAIAARLEARRRARDLLLFAGIEERGMEARGINLLTARRKGHRVAEAAVALAAHYRGSADGSLGLPLASALRRASEQPEEFLAAPGVAEESEPPGWRVALARVGGALVGPRARFLVGALALAGFFVWMDQNALISAEDARQTLLSATNDREKATDAAGKLGRKLIENVQGVADAEAETKSLEFAYVPPWLADRFDGFGLGLAGLILVLSSASARPRLAGFALAGAAVAAIGARLVEPGARPLGLASLAAMGIGALIYIGGYSTGRGRR